MEQFIGCDAHKKFSLFIAMNEEGAYGRAIRVGHERERMRAFLEALPVGSRIAASHYSAGGPRVSATAPWPFEADK